MTPKARSTLVLSAITLLSLPFAQGCNGRGGEGRDSVSAIPEAPPVSDALYSLGQALFFDKILSGNAELSCATCHHPSLGTDDDQTLPRGVGATGLGATRTGGAIIARNAPALFNLHVYPTMFWDSRVAVGEDGHLVTPAGAHLTEAMEQTLTYGVVGAQAMFPVTSPTEMRGQPGESELADFADDDFTGIWGALMERLGAVPEYVAMFEDAYPGASFDEMTFAHAGNAIAAYEIRAFERTDSPYQRFLLGDDQAMSRRQQEGMDSFFNAGCGNCHTGPLLSDFEHHNTALAQFGPGAGHGASGRDDFGREGVTGDDRDRYAFRTPSLINVALTGPFGHAGQVATLRDFVDHYRNPEDKLRRYDIRREVADLDLQGTLVANTDAVLANIDRRMRDVRRFNEDDVVAFLEATTADSAGDLADVVPDSVPSGLPVH